MKPIKTAREILRDEKPSTTLYSKSYYNKAQVLKAMETYAEQFKRELELMTENRDYWMHAYKDRVRQ